MVRWFLLLPIDLLATPWCWLTAPIVVLFADDNGWLPRRLWWYQTPDNSLDGDNGWRTEHFLGWPRYLKRVLWLWRNPMYGLAWDGPMAAKVGSQSDTVVVGDPRIKNRADARAGGYVCKVDGFWNAKAIISGYPGVLAFFIFWMAVADGVLPSEWVRAPDYVIGSGFAGLIYLLNRDLAGMFEFGWKLQPWAQGRPFANRAMYVFSVRLTAFYPNPDRQ